MLRDKYSWIGSADSELPDGWRIAFGDEMCQEIQEIYNEMTDEQKEEFEALQIKEKYGTLRVYLHCAWPYYERIQEILQQYEKLSWNYCITCGAPATMCGTDYIFPCCEKCNEKYELDAVYKIPTD